MCITVQSKLAQYKINNVRISIFKELYFPIYSNTGAGLNMISLIRGIEGISQVRQWSAHYDA